jgi:hypothetical protein
MVAIAEGFLTMKVLVGTSYLVLDVSLPGVDGFELQRKLANAFVPVSIIFNAGHGDIPMTGKSIKFGAVELLTTPLPSGICALGCGRPVLLAIMCCAPEKPKGQPLLRLPLQLTKHYGFAA